MPLNTSGIFIGDRYWDVEDFLEKNSMEKCRYYWGKWGMFIVWLAILEKCRE